mgnify:CR=1 FL=1
MTKQHKFTISGQISERFEAEQKRTGFSVSHIVGNALDAYLRTPTEYQELEVWPRPAPKPKPPRKRATVSPELRELDAKTAKFRKFPPSLEDVIEEFRSRGKGEADAKAFHKSHTRNAWKLKSGARMQNWGRAVGTWIRIGEQNGWTTPEPVEAPRGFKAL